MITFFIAPDSSVENPTADQVLANCINVKTKNEARAYREAYLQWHQKRNQIKTPNDDVYDRNEINWAYISAKSTRSNLLNYIKRNVLDKGKREQLIELFDLNSIPVKPVYFERHISA